MCDDEHLTPEEFTRRRRVRPVPITREERIPMLYGTRRDPGHKHMCLRKCGDEVSSACNADGDDPADYDGERRCDREPARNPRPLGKDKPVK